MKVFFIFLMSVILSCGDMLAHKQKVYGNYYMVEGDAEGDISLNYKISDNGFIQRVPSRIIEYAVVEDSLIIAKQKSDVDTTYYVINIKNDNAYAEAKSFLIGSFKKGDFDNWLKGKELELNFIKVK